MPNLPSWPVASSASPSSPPYRYRIRPTATYQGYEGAWVVVVEIVVVVARRGGARRRKRVVEMIQPMTGLPNAATTTTTTTSPPYYSTLSPLHLKRIGMVVSTTTTTSPPYYPTLPLPFQHIVMVVSLPGAFLPPSSPHQVEGGHGDGHKGEGSTKELQPPEMPDMRAGECHMSS